MKHQPKRSGYFCASIWSVLYIVAGGMVQGLDPPAGYVTHHRRLCDAVHSLEKDSAMHCASLPEYRATAEWTKAILIALIITLAVRTLFIEAYKIPTPSMEKTLLVGDYLFVSKLAYGPKLPNTPLSVPFMPNMLPDGTSDLFHENPASLHPAQGLRKGQTQ